MNKKLKKSRAGMVLVLTLVGALLSACDPQPGSDANSGSSDGSQLSSSGQDGIVNGSPVTSREKVGRSVVAIVSEQEQGQALCTGSIVTKDMILTAAHCVEGSPRSIEVVFATDIQQADVSQRRPVINFLQNPKWKAESNSGLGDLAVLQFAGGLPEGYQVMTFASPTFELQPGMETLLVGYGVTDGDSHADPGTLRETFSQILEFKSETQVVTDGRQSGVCFGDSGGPALSKLGNSYVQWGIASSVTSPNCNTESIHTSILSYESWINETMDSLRSQGSESDSNEAN